MLDESTGIYYSKKGEIKLARLEAELLSMLIQNNGNLVTFSELCEYLYGISTGNNRRCLHQAAYRLNKKLKDEIVITSKIAVGYRLEYIGG